MGIFLIIQLCKDKIVCVWLHLLLHVYSMALNDNKKTTEVIDSVFHFFETFFYNP